MKWLAVALVVVVTYIAHWMIEDGKRYSRNGLNPWR